MDVKTVAPQFRGIPALDIDAKLGYGPGGMTMSPNGKLERRILWNLLKHLAANGWHCRVAYDGDVSYMRSDDGGVFEDGENNVWESGRSALTAKEVMEIAFNLDEVSLRFGNGFGKGHEELHGVYIVLGNGTDIVCDWNYDEDDRDGFNAVMEAFDSDVYA